MKKCDKYNTLALAGAVILLLTACEPGMSEENAQVLVVQSELLRKNGNVLIEQGKAKEAVEVFDRLIEIDPENPLAYNGKAVAFDYTGNHLAAQDIYQVALSLSPDSVTIKNNLAMSLILNQQIDQAIILLESLVNVPTENESASNIIRHNLAMAYGISGRPEKATKLSLKDLTPAQARENVRFYERYVTRNSKGKKTGGKGIAHNNHNIGFITPEIEAEHQSIK